MQIGRGAPRVRESLFGGQGRVLVWDLLGGARVDPFTAVLACELEPDGRVGRHVQAHFPELVIGLEGHGEARVDGSPLALGPGLVVHLPRGSTLEITNARADAPLRYLIVKAHSQSLDL